MKLGPNQQAWIDALRSGKYQQGTSFLINENKYCCLGVLAAIAGCSMSKDENGAEFFNNCEEFAPQQAMDFVALKNDCGGFGEDYMIDSLTYLNDNGKTFKEIADIIEEKADILFNEPR